MTRQERQKILIVDDKPENLLALERLLGEVDAHVVRAESGTEALSACQEHNFTLAVLDVRMPEMDGYELAERLREDEKTRLIPIIFVTASANEEQHLEQGYSKGAVDFLVKPYNPNILLVKVRLFLELAAQRTELQLHQTHLEQLVEERSRELLRAKQRSEHLGQVLRALRKVNQLSSEQGSPQKIIDGACKILVENRAFNSAWIVLLDESGAHSMSAEAGVGPGFAALAERFTAGQWVGCVEECLRTGSRLPKVASAEVCAGCPTPTKTPPRGCFYVGLKYQETLLGVLTVSVPDVNQIDDEERSLLAELASDVAFKVHAITQDERHRETEAARLRSETRYRQLTENVPGVVYQYLWRGDGARGGGAKDEFLYISSGVRETYGLEPEAVMQDSSLMWRAIHPDDVTDFAQSIQQAADTDRPWKREWRIITSTGETKWMKGTARQERQQDGSLIWDGLIMDITERKRDELALLESEERFRNLVENTSDVFFNVDTEGKVTYISPAIESLIGLAPERVVGRVLMEFIHPEDLERVGLYFARSLSERLPSLECRVVSSSGETKWIRNNNRTLRRDGELIGLQGVVSDITVQKQAERELGRHREHLEDLVEKRTADLQASNRELESFAYSVSHDSRAPLRSIDGFSKAFLEDYGHLVDDMGQDQLGRVRAAAQRMGELIEDILKLSRLARAKTRETDIDLSSMAQGIIAELKAGDPDRQVDVDIAAGLSARGDPTLLRAALENLLANGWKFTSCRHRGRIELGTEQVDETTAYFVRDNGAGFDMAYADKLFGVFQRLHDSTEFPGTGVGLATVKRVIQKHGGRVWGESEVDRGATFYFTLPGRHPDMTISEGTDTIKL